MTESTELEFCIWTSKLQMSRSQGAGHIVAASRLQLVLTAGYALNS